VAAEAERSGLFVLRGPGTLEFLSTTTGRRVALWVERSGVLLDAASNRIGRTASPFGALARAVELDRAARGVVACHQRPRAARGGTGRPATALGGPDAAAGHAGVGNGEGGQP
jgi:hypothetical protein